MVEWSTFLTFVLVLGSAVRTDGLGTGISVTSSRDLKALAVSVSPESWIGEISGKVGKEFGECSLKTTFPPAERRGVTTECDKGLSCVPVLTTPTSMSRNRLLERAGVCVQFPREKEINGDPKPSSAYIFDPQREIPLPLGYFPFTHGNVNSWPFPTYEGILRGQSFVDDNVFGSVLKCTKNTVKLPSIPYAGTGELAINFWMKPGAPGEGIGFEYIFSHMKSGATPGLRGDSQIQIYLPREPLPAHGVVRAVVKDSNDLDEGASSDVFIDSDGEVGNNSGREFDKTHPDIYDGKWHMVTVSTKMNQERGFSLFVDGELVGELGGGEMSKSTNSKAEHQVTGGDPIDLDGEIHLCGRAENSTDRFFEGKLAHLSVFNSPLSAENVRNLYETLLLGPMQVEGLENADDAKNAHSGSPCLFPALFRGEWVDECVPLENTQECPTSAGMWEECDFFASEHDDNFQTFENGMKPKGKIVTIDGDNCELPVYYFGVLRHECVDIYGVPSCKTAGGVWKECAASDANVKIKKKTKVDRKTITGKHCVFPFDYLGKSFDDCTMVSGSWACKVPAGDFEPCAVVRDPETMYGANPNATVLSRVTKTDELCFFPFWYGEDSVADCFIAAGGIPSCPTISGELLECAPVKITLTGQPCAFPFLYDGEVYYDCVDVEDMSYCRNAGGVMEQCAPSNSIVEPYVPNQDLRILTSRATVEEENCAFPFWYKGKLVSDCVEEDGKEFCRTGGGLWQECNPQIMTTDGRKCSIPYQYEDEFHWTCNFVNNTFQCPTAREEPWGECIGDFAYPPGLVPIAELEDDLEEAEGTDSIGIEDLSEEETFEVDHSRESNGLDGGKAPGTTHQDEFPGESWIAELTGKPGQEMGPCQLNGVFAAVKGQGKLPACAEDLSCLPVLAPVESLKSTSSANSQIQRIGACIRFPGADTNAASPVGAYVFDPQRDMPIPIGYFPLTHNNVDSWPFPSFQGQTNGRKFVKDEVFGSVLKCGKGTVTLPSVPYAASGTFAINMWIKAKKPAKGVGFEYIFSHMQEGAEAGIRSASQIQLYLPKKSLPAHGVLRAVIKDDDDIDEGRASDAFLDSDGEVGNNLERAISNGHVDFYDGQWHMLTVTTKPVALESTGKGFRMYVDGAFAGEMGAITVQVKDDNDRPVDLQVTGGDPMDLTGEINLCGRAVDSEGRYFGGNIAHLSLFDRSLTDKQVTTLFETYFATKAQSDEDPIREGVQPTESGKPCLFPAFYRGTWINECIDINEESQCPSAPGEWEACAQKSSPGYVTVDDEDCDLPVFYMGAVHNECVPINGEPKCYAKGGKWKGCKSPGESAGKEVHHDDHQEDDHHDNHQEDDHKAGNYETVDGEECQLPVFYDGEVHHHCVQINGKPMCHPKGGEWKGCRAKNSKPLEETEPKPVSSNDSEDENTSISAPVEQDPNTIYTNNPDAPLISRITVNGERCYFPFWYGKESIGGCFMHQGKQSCPTRSGEVKECAPLRLTVEGIPCAMPFTLNGVQHKDCAEVDDVEKCRTADGSMAQCASASSTGENSTQKDEYRIVTARATEKRANCAFPFWYKGQLTSDCVKQGNDEYCRTMLGSWEKCAPQRLTVDDKKCSIPFQYEGKFMFDCIEIDGERKCPTGNLEPWGVCAENGSPSASAARTG